MIKNPIQAGKDAYNGAKSWGSRLYSGAVDKIQGFGESVSNLWNGTDSSGVGYAETQGGIKNDSKSRQLAMYNALRSEGFSHAQALAVNGEIGRENGFGSIMFSQHNDPAKDKNGNVIRNTGVLSWNGSRFKSFQKFMKDRGLMNANGDMPQTQEALKAQAAFIKQEMQSKDYKGKLNNFLTNPDQSPDSYAPEMAKYIGWARGQKTIRGAKGQRVPFDSPTHEQRVRDYIKSTDNMARNQAGTVKSPIAVRQNTPTITPASATIITPNQATPKGAKALADFATNAPMPVSNVRAQVITPFKPPTMQASNVAKVAPVTAEMNSITPVLPRPKTQAQQDTMIAQNVSDRGLAHILTGGIGFRSA